MYALISELNQSSNLVIEKIRQECLSACGLETPTLRWLFHVSWQGAEMYDLPETENRVKMIAKMFAPVDISINGIGIFTGEKPVLHFTVTRAPAVSALNQTLWESLLPLSEGMNPLFSPEKWVPHISLIYGEENSVSALSCVVQKLIPMQLRMTVKIDHLSLVYYQDEKSGVEFRYPLTGPSNLSLNP